MITSISKFKEILESMTDFNQISNISTLDVDIELEINLKHTYHSLERQGRSDKRVKNIDIKETFDLASEQIIESLLQNKIDINEPIWIYNSSNNLNVVGSLTYNNNKYIFKIITVMFTKEFYNKKDTYKITV